MMKWFILFILLQTNLLFGQCLDGTLVISGPGCGCLSGCNLTSLGGPNCSPSVTGDCNSGQLAMYKEIIVPAGCTFTGTAEFKTRPGGCTSSGMDSGDKLKIDTRSGTKVYKSGTGNANVSDAITVTGPDTIVIIGSANRADEIITYTIVDSGTCPSCFSLGIDLIEFSGICAPERNEISWKVENWIDFSRFILERSDDLNDWIELSEIAFSGNNYTIFDYVSSGTLYYRLKMIDMDGKYKYSEVIVLKRESDKRTVIQIFDIMGNSVNDTTGIRILLFDDGHFLKKIYE